MDIEHVLSAPMPENDAKADTIRDYLVALLERLWSEGEGFSGKRPFGNSSWEYDLYRALVTANLISGSIDEYGDLGDFSKQDADQLIFSAIKALG